MTDFEYSMCGMPSAETERKQKTDRCVFHFPESVSPASRYSSRDEFVPLCFSSFLNKLLLPHSLSFEFDRQTKDRMEQ